MGAGHPGGPHQGRVGVASFVADLTAAEFRARSSGAGKAVLHEDAAAQMSVFRVPPRSGIPAHAHSRVHDLFVGVQGELEIRSRAGMFVLRPGSFCSMPPGVPHEVWNGSEVEEAYFLLVHTDYEHFDFVGQVELTECVRYQRPLR